MRCAFIYFFAVITTYIKKNYGAEVVVQIPAEMVQDQDGLYRLDYRPPYGNPPPNQTFSPAQVAQGIKLTRALPGTKYDFNLFYSNDTISDYINWTASITTVPSPPSNLTIFVRSGKQAHVTWDPPNIGGYSAFKLKVIPLSEPQNSNTNVIIKENQLPFVLRELTPGASYELQLYTVYENKESTAYISSNFTTRPNAPGRFIVWYRNETTMLVLWQPPYPPGIYSHYMVSIDPSDAKESVLTVPKYAQTEKSGEPPGPAQAAFLGLVPGRAYNITVETVSSDKISLPTTAQYRTIPLAPRNITFDLHSLTSTSFVVRWEAPKGKWEFDRYQVSLGVKKKQSPIIIEGGAPREHKFEGLQPGRTYNVLVKTVSGIVASWPTTGNVTTRPLPVVDVNAIEDEETKEITLSWSPNDFSIQDHYQVVFQEVEAFTGDSRTKIVNGTSTVDKLHPGGNYSLSVTAMSNNIGSEPTVVYIATKPASPIILDLEPIQRGLNISWKSDVTSRQDKYAVVYTRNDTANSVTRQTEDKHVLLTDLFPGAGYEIKVYAISHGLWSDPFVSFQPVYPNQVRSLAITEMTNTTITLAWQAPIESLFTHYIVRYQTVEDEHWKSLPAINTTGAVVTDLLPGERYIIQVRSVSHHVESYKADAQEVLQTVPPNAVIGINYQLDSQNITFEWPRPEGRIDYYTFIWWNIKTPERKKSKEILGTQPTEGFDRKQTMLIGELMSGELYNFTVYTTAHDVTSEIISLAIRTRPRITSDIQIVNQLETRSFTLRYTATPATVATFDKYRFMLSDANILPKEKLAIDDDRKIIFDGLVPGRLYNITAWTISGNVMSQPLIRQDRLFPEPVKNITATDISDTTITLTWIIPEGDYDTFEVQYLTDEEILFTNHTSEDHITLSRLRPHRAYTFTVLTRAGSLDQTIMRQSTPVSAPFTTKESTPGKVEQFAPVDVQPRNIKFSWSLPENEQNGVLLGFNIKYGIKGSSSSLNERHFSPEELSGTIPNLIPGKTYFFQIEARTRVGPGRVKYWEETMPIWAPPEPNHQVFPTEVSRTSNTIRIRYRKNYFSNENGKIIAYSIIVAEDDKKISKGLEMRAWRDVQSYSVWPPYQVNEPYYPFNDSSVEDFDIGIEQNCHLKGGYCNGELKPGSKYRVKIRAYTDHDKFADTYFSHPIVTDFESGNVGLAVAIPVLILVLVVVVVMIMRRRQVCPFPKKGMEDRDGNSLQPVPDIFIETSRPVQLSKFADHYRFMSADSEYHFSEEYEALRMVGHDLPHTAAELPCNRPKNRFTNILPYDHCRVKLQPTDDEEGSDYINANYVSGHNSPREFIVTQGPLPSTRDDFWRMCWESNSRAIVMLTRCIERGREKCDHYWPYDMQPVYYGDIQVTILNESHFPDWNVSEFRVCKGETCRVVRHFHFTTWPDFGVPDPPQTLVRFVRAFRERVGSDQKPIVVHCSAGVGRSGTFIALDRILFSIRKFDYVDIYGIVHEMRRERVWMVQTEHQYICIHQCLMAVLEGRENDHSPAEIHDNQGFEDDEGIAESGM